MNCGKLGVRFGKVTARVIERSMVIGGPMRGEQGDKKLARSAKGKEVVCWNFIREDGKWYSVV